MDELKLKKWKENFQEGITTLQIEFDSFFPAKKINQFYHLKEDGVTPNLSLEITDDTLPKEIKERLINLFNATKPEDSI